MCLFISQEKQHINNSHTDVSTPCPLVALMYMVSVGTTHYMYVIQSDHEHAAAKQQGPRQHTHIRQTPTANRMVYFTAACAPLFPSDSCLRTLVFPLESYFMMLGALCMLC